MDDSTLDHDALMQRVDTMMSRGETAPRLARDPVNLPQINTWLEAIGDPNPVYRETTTATRLHGGPVAPPAMAQVWTMFGLDPHRPAHDPLHGTMQLLDEAGFTSVLGTNCDQTYARHLHPGERVSITTRLESVVGPKRTGVGEGYFVTTRSTWRVGDEEVATMMFRVLKFKPAPRVDRTRITRPQRNADTDFFWEGTAAGELRIQSCGSCDALRHPPGPMCPRCHASNRGYVVAEGTGVLHSFTVHHAPQLPGRKLPVTIGLVDLPEGVRMVGELMAAPDHQWRIGDPVAVAFECIDDDLTLPVWELDVPRPGLAPAEQDADDDTETLPAWELPVTTTLVVAGALATRDFQDVHHDRDLAIARGSKDIFMNILTTTGLVHRYVGEWVGDPAARVTSCALRLGAPAYPGDTMTFTGTVVDRDHAQVVVDVVGSVPVGDHVTARVTVALAGEEVA
ncbi:OB-fold domain-containing protein [Nocardioides limicola]|uniref:OB-fold domain-containing protein n=1 Tax=Nocardioides limicola TaxID=2803368 RepID=UPI00193B8F5A|nr:OB-fold domain-containing protein [Nocardioides sp. DJM-14]